MSGESATRPVQSGSGQTPGAGTSHQAKRDRIDAYEAGYSKDLKQRQLQMIAIGGAIGTGLFLGAGGRLAVAGPSLAIVYLICGVFAFIILRALGELVMYRPSSGAFVSYAREFIGEKGAFVSGWLYFMFWALTGIIDATAVATYMQFWGVGDESTQWIIALIALVLVTVINLVGVKWFGEMEFWFALIKVGALTAFLIVGTVILGTRVEVAGHTTGPQLIFDNGGLFPNGILPAIVLTQGVVFAYAAIEMVGIAAGETKDPHKVVPRAINSVMLRVALFYVGSVLLLVMLLPWTAYKANESPFVTFFAELGVPGIDHVMNFVVVTAALSSLNSGIYSTGRTLRSLGNAGSAPQFTTYMSKQKVPVGGIALTVAVSLIGIWLNYVLPKQAFEIALNASALGTIGVWAMIVITHLLYRRHVQRGEAQATSFKLWASPFTNYVTLVFLAAVLVLMCFDFPIGTWTIACVPILILLFVAGWYAVRKKVKSLQSESDRI